MTWWEYILTVWGVITFGTLFLSMLLAAIDERRLKKIKKVNDLWEDWYERS